MRRTIRSGFTLVELLVVIAIIGVLVGLLLPAIQAAREAARRSSCTHNLSQVILAVQNYDAAHLAFPTGVANATGPIRNEPRGNHLSWVVGILPFIEEQNTFKAIDRSVGAYAAKNQPARMIPITILNCPSSYYYWHDEGPPISNYAGCHHDTEAPIDSSNNGVFYLNSRTTQREVADGMSQTIFLGETNDDVELHRNLGWMSGTRATLRNTGSPPNLAFYAGPGVLPPPILNDPDTDYYRNAGEGEGDVEEPAEVGAEADESEDSGPPEPDDTTEETDENGAPYDFLWVGGFGSQHTGDLSLFAFGDGHVTSITSSISPVVFQQLGHRADGKLLNRSELD